MIHRLATLGLLAATAGLMLVASAPPANAQTICSETANVGWETDLDTLSVTGVIVEVEGCEDDAYVGIELITDDGDIPPDGPLEGRVDDDRARFDVTGLEVGIQPLTGIRVYLEVAGEPTPILMIDVDQRFFNPAGNEQFGLGMITTLTLGVGQEYVVPADYARYDPVVCGDLAVTAPDNLVAEGTGTFTARESGTHLACYQQQPGSDGEPGPGQPDAELPEVLDEIIEDPEGDANTDDVSTDDGGAASDDPPTTGQETIDDPASVLGELSELGHTGANAIATFFIGFTLVVSGGALLRWRRGNTGAASAAGS